MESFLILVAFVFFVIFAIVMLFCWVFGMFLDAIHGKGRDAVKKIFDDK